MSGPDTTPRPPERLDTPEDFGALADHLLHVDGPVAVLDYLRPRYTPLPPNFAGRLARALREHPKARAEPPGSGLAYQMPRASGGFTSEDWARAQWPYSHAAREVTEALGVRWLPLLPPAEPQAVLAPAAEPEEVLRAPEPRAVIAPPAEPEDALPESLREVRDGLRAIVETNGARRPSAIVAWGVANELWAGAMTGGAPQRDKYAAIAEGIGGGAGSVRNAVSKWANDSAREYSDAQREAINRLVKLANEAGLPRGG